MRPTAPHPLSGRSLSRRSLLLGTAGAAAGLSPVLAACSSPGSAPSVSTTPAPSTAASSTTAPTTTAPSAMTASPSSTSSVRTPSPGPSKSATGLPDPTVAGTVVDDLDVPWGIAFLKSGHALVSERNTGRLVRVTPAGKTTTLGEVAGVQAPSGTGEGGFLGLALAPGDQSTVFGYITTAEDNRVVRFSIDGGRVGRPEVVLSGIPTSTHHHGGRLLFDDAGLLYVSTGDAEVPANAQDKGSLAGKVLRIRADGRAAPGNPFGNRTWSYGHRNVQGLAFDTAGRLWATEFGDKAADELNLIVKGANYGWPAVEGRSDDSAYTAPKRTWSPTSTSSPSGLAISRSTAFVAALQGQCLFSMALDGRSAAAPKKHFAGAHGRLRTVAVAPDGALWLTTSNTDGRQTPGRHDDKILRVTL